ncbi:MAG: hypothetical protein RRZ42_06305, partial [Oscillospiraceae bacterium]
NCCDISPEIVSGYYTAEGDSSPDTPTRLFRVFVMRCRNPQCPNFGNTWEERTEERMGLPDIAPGGSGRR